MIDVFIKKKMLIYYNCGVMFIEVTWCSGNSAWPTISPTRRISHMGDFRRTNRSKLFAN